MLQPRQHPWMLLLFLLLSAVSADQDVKDTTKSFKPSPHTPAIASLGLKRVLVAVLIVILLTVALVKFFLPRNIIKGTVLETVAASSTATWTATTSKAKKSGESAPHAWIDGTPILQVGINFCSACEEGLGPGQGVTCVICGRCSHRHHTTRVEREHACKRISLPKGGVVMDGKVMAEHQWAEGNLPLGAVCSVCTKPVGTTPRLCDFRCLWCRVAVHSQCRSRLTPVCDLGPISEVVVDPRWVAPVRSRSNPSSPSSKKTRTVRTPRAFRSIQEKYAVSLAPKTNTGRKPKPLLAFINPKSGQQEGPMILRYFYSVLNPCQVVDLSREKPQDTLDMFAPVLSKCRIVVCGGDGTISWILNLLQDMKLDGEPPVGVIPMGTGNDLARVLGWGGGFAGESLDDVLSQIKFAKPRDMDRWKVTIQSKKAGFWSGRAPKTVFMSNYLSVGCDADIALNFHSTREQNPNLFKSRFLNKVWYFVFGAKLTAGSIVQALNPNEEDFTSPPPSPIRESVPKKRRSSSNLVVDAKPPDSPISHTAPPPRLNLGEIVELYLDGVSVSTDGLAAIILLNIPSYGGGAPIYQTLERDGFPPCLANDGQLEVLGAFNSVHMGACIVGLATPRFIGQVHEVRIVMKERVAMQIDGEPWIQGPCETTIVHHRRVSMLARSFDNVYSGSDSSDDAQLDDSRRVQPTRKAKKA